MPAPAVCIFDLDGTLVDSLQDVAEAFNEGLELLGLEPRPVSDYRFLVGDGIPALCRRMIGESHPHLVNRLIELARSRYRTRPLRHTKPYAGIPEAISALHRAEVKLAVLSNKPHPQTDRIVRALWPGGEFRRVQGYLIEAQRKPDPHFIHHICAELDTPVERCCMIGDTPTDVETARRAGAECVAVSWGFRPRETLREAGARHIVDSPAELLAHFGLAPLGG